MLSVSTSDSYHHGDLRAALLQAAGAMLEAEGVETLKLREVARRAGVSHNAPYRHFANRQALLAALAAEGFVELGATLAAGRGRDAGVAYVRFALRRPQRFRLMFGGLVPIDAHPDLGREAGQVFDQLQRSFADGRSPARATRSAAAAWSLVHGLAQLLLDGHLQHAAGGDPLQFADEVIGAVKFNSER